VPSQQFLTSLLSATGDPASSAITLGKVVRRTPKPQWSLDAAVTERTARLPFLVVDRTSRNHVPDLFLPSLI